MPAAASVRTVTAMSDVQMHSFGKDKLTAELKLKNTETDAEVVTDPL
jgi:hypothetical protein